MRRDHSQPDEGFSEERSQSDSDLAFPAAMDAGAKQLLAAVMQLPAEQRKLVMERLVLAAPNRDKEAIGALCESLTHFDPAHYLPNELVLAVFAYLDPKDLLTASLVSRPWRERSQDDKLWRGCFAREGWVLDAAKMSEYEAQAKKRGPKAARAMAGDTGGGELQRRGSRKRKTEEAFSESEGVVLAGSSGGSSVGAQDATDVSMQGNASDDSDDGMDGVEIPSSHSTLVTPLSPNAHSSPSSTTDAATSPFPVLPSLLKLSPTMWRAHSVDAGNPKLSWPWLYKQRRRLENNWESTSAAPADKGYTMFSLPHPRHPDEGHKECVYTIQHTAAHLVSGSRDRTIRRWDLDTCRLIGEPLRGHDMSVLCLQFDERPDHDIIVSGGSDAYVIIWRFSTGQILKKITRAHSESVLNLRFDDRYIVTCSKDTTIKIWSRAALAKDSPLIPSHQLANLDNPAHYLNTAETLIQEYTLLATLVGHKAAVNAVIIHANTIVSASGDRTIIAWDIDQGRSTRQYVGHTKGIACVQFDGRRIVSGSSDNSVRIFDSATAAEIACLSGHENLVRTVQARFGDLETVSEGELRAQARKADRGFWALAARKRQGAVCTTGGNSNAVATARALLRNASSTLSPAHVHSSLRNAARNPGSSDPARMLAVGTATPPGGGGPVGRGS
ncbi:hypothetical protein LTR08_005365 [Meristemomyces frigidus]|nr:hypothetical protein LTR08_005365 [Meristemomyces frigidus]